MFDEFYVPADPTLPMTHLSCVTAICYNTKYQNNPLLRKPLLVSAPQGRRGATGQRNTLGARRDRGNSPRDPKKHLPWQCYYLYGRLQKGVYPLLPGTLHPI